MMTVVRRLSFSAGHRLVGHEGKCAVFHGHNYLVYFHATAEHLDAMGRVVDFGVLKERLGPLDRHALGPRIYLLHGGRGSPQGADDG